MNFREARVEDIPQIKIVRNSVKEKTLSNPELVTNKNCKDLIMHRGKGWVCEIENRVVGFAIADLQENNIWALFIQPGFEGKGIGKKLHDDMLDWYFGKTKSMVWLGTAPNTRAELFYRKAGWKQTGTRANGEIKFEMTDDEWRSLLKQRI